MKKFLVITMSILSLTVGGLVPHVSAQEAEANDEFDMESIIVGTIVTLKSWTKFYKELI